jgi:hypothetical protein
MSCTRAAHEGYSRSKRPDPQNRLLRKYPARGPWRFLACSHAGNGDPRKVTADKGRRTFEPLMAAMVPVLVQLSAAKNGDFPFIIRGGH